MAPKKRSTAKTATKPAKKRSKDRAAAGMMASADGPAVLASPCV
eukprot:gene7991-7387_t